MAGCPGDPDADVGEGASERYVPASAITVKAQPSMMSTDNPVEPSVHNTDIHPGSGWMPSTPRASRETFMRLE